MHRYRKDYDIEEHVAVRGARVCRVESVGIGRAITVARPLRAEVEIPIGVRWETREECHLNIPSTLANIARQHVPHVNGTRESQHVENPEGILGVLTNV